MASGGGTTGVAPAKPAVDGAHLQGQVVGVKRKPTKVEEAAAAYVAPQPAKANGQKPVVVIDPEIMSGTPCFAGTRVPVRNLLDYIEGGDTLDDFLRQFPSVSRDQAVEFLEQSSQQLLAAAGAKS